MQYPCKIKLFIFKYTGKLSVDFRGTTILSVRRGDKVVSAVMAKLL